MHVLLTTLCVLLAGCEMTAPAMGVRGLLTNGNPQVAPSGTLRVAENVGFEVPDVASPRPGFKLSSNNNASYNALRLVPWKGSLLRYNTDGTSSWWTAASTAITETGSTNLTYASATRVCGVEARKNLYLNTADGVRKLTSTSDVVASPAGIDAGPLVTNAAASAGTFLAVNYYAAYRAVSLRRDANGLVMRSPAVGQALVRNLTAGATAVALTFYLAPGDAAGDFIEIYRTRTNAAVPGLEFFLVTTYEVTSADVTAGYASYTDDVANADLGSALYTNDSRGGIESANYKPPAAEDIAPFNGSLFFADTLSPLRETLSWDEGGDCTGSATGIGYRSEAGVTLTNGSASFVVASTTGLQVGMIVSAVGTSGFAATSRITNIVGLTISVLNNWTGATAAYTVLFTDSIRVGDEYFLAGSALNVIMSSRVSSAVTTASAYYHAYSTGQYLFINIGVGQSFGRVSVTFEELLRGRTSDEIKATHGDEYFPPLPLMTVAGDPDKITRSDDLPNGLAWSKKDEPEHVPLTNYERVGMENKAILRLAPTRDALWIFKEDGLWRLSGSASPRWRIDPFDPTLRLLTPDALCIMDDVVYAWTNRGVVAVSDSGVVPMSGAIADQLEPYERKLLVTANQYLPHWLVADESSGNIILGTRDPDGSTTYASKIFVYNVATRRWSTWKAGTSATPLYRPTHMVYEPTLGLVVANSTSDIAQQRKLGDAQILSSTLTPIHADYEYSGTLIVNSATELRLSVAVGWTPAVGDVIVQGAYVAIATAVVNADTVTTTDTTGFSGAAATVYKGFPVDMEWNAVGNPAVKSRWRELAYAFEQTAGLYALTSTTVGQNNYTDSLSRTLTYTAPSDTVERANTVRFHVGRDTARSTVLYPGLEMTTALSPWRLSGIAAVAEPITTRVMK